MKLENRTRYRTVDLERIILAALEEGGIEHHGRDRVVVVYGTYFTGWAYKGKIRRWNGNDRMRLRLPRPNPVRPFDFLQFVWLVRHEVGHWRGLDHDQMADSMMYWTRGERKRIKGPVGSELPPPPWAEGLTVAVEDEEPDLRKPRPTADEVREKKLAHAEAMLARATRKAKLAATVEKRWVRRVFAAERAIAKAAGRGT